jgi:hypothetical protein
MLPSVGAGEIKPMNPPKIREGLGQLSRRTQDNPSLRAQNVSLVTYDRETGNVYEQVFGPVNEAGYRPTVWEGFIGNVPVPKDLEPSQTGQFLEDPVRQLSAQAHGQTFPPKQPETNGADIEPIEETLDGEMMRINLLPTEKDIEVE